MNNINSGSSTTNSAMNSTPGPVAGETETKNVTLAPPNLIRALRIVVPTLAGLLAIGLFTFAYYQSYDRANKATFDNYVAQLYEQRIAQEVPKISIEELLEETFNPPASLSEDGFSDLRSFQYIVSQQLAGVDGLKIFRVDSVVFFQHARSEYTLELRSSESYKFIDDYISKSSVE